MGKTSEALFRAQSEQGKYFLQPVQKDDRTPAVWDPMYGVSRAAPPWFKDLKTRLELRKENQNVKTILFTSTSMNNGCTSVSAGFAKSLCVDFNQKVLLIDANVRESNLESLFGNEYIQNLEDILIDNKLSFNQSAGNISRNLQVITCNSREREISTFLISEQFNNVLESAKKYFDYVILDSSPISLFSETRIICSKVDGVILIIESGKTKRLAALNAKKEIESTGGLFLGSVLNKRKFYIPKWLYRRL